MHQFSDLIYIQSLIFGKEQDDPLAGWITQRVKQAFAGTKGFRDIIKSPGFGFWHEDCVDWLNQIDG